jgi:peptide/nickel transport system substrate-binding protein
MVSKPVRVVASGSFLLCLLSTIGGGCGPPGEHAGSATSSTLTILTPSGDEWLLGPGWDEPAQQLVFLPLVRRGSGGQIEGVLARSWERSADHRTWTVHLRSDIRWHDGVPFTAHDVEFTLNLDPLQGGSSLTVIDDSTYRLDQHRPGAIRGTPLDDYWVFYPKHLLAHLDPETFRSWAFWLEPVGNGPYKYVRHLPKTMIELAANEDYFRGRPRTDRIVLRFGRPTATELLAGNADILQEVGEADILMIDRDHNHRFRVRHMISPDAVNAIVWNQRRRHFADPTVRRALTLAIDRHELARLLNLPDATPVLDGFMTGSWGSPDDAPATLAHDPERAGRLLDETGWRDADGDGIRERDGEPFRFSALVQPGYQQQNRTAVYVQAQLQTVGVRMEIVVLEGAVLTERLRSGEFDAVFHPLVNPSSSHPRAFSGTDGISAAAGYHKPVLTELRDALLVAWSAEERDSLNTEFTKVLQADMPATVLYPQVWSDVITRRLMGLSDSGAPWRRLDLIHQVEDLWLLEEAESGR